MDNVLPNIRVETENSARPTVEITDLPNVQNDVSIMNTRKYKKKKFAFKDDQSDASSKTESINSFSRNKEKFTSPFSTAQNDVSYDIFANPKKKIMETNDSDSGSGSEYSDSGSDSVLSNNSVYSTNSLIKEQKKPALSRLELKIKKKDMLLKLHEAEQNGYVITGKYNMSSDLEEMEAEYELYEKKMEQSTMIDFLQDGLMFLIKGIEVLNGIYNPMSLKLNGLSDKIYDRKDKLDHIFRRLAIKYSGGTEMPPELSLIFTIAGAMIITHLSNTALQGGGIPGIGNIGDMLGKSGIMENISSMFKQMSEPVAQNAPSPTGDPSDIKMKPPSLDISNLLKTMRNPGPRVKSEDPRDELPFQAMNVPSPNPFPQPTRNMNFSSSRDEDRFMEENSSVSSSEETLAQSISISIPSKTSSTRRKKKIKNSINIL
jgi:hypothetical protein